MARQVARFSALLLEHPPARRARPRAAAAGLAPQACAREMLARTARTATHHRRVVWGPASTCADALVQPHRAAGRRGGHVTSRRTALWSTSPRGSQPRRLGHHCLAAGCSLTAQSAGKQLQHAADGAAVFSGVPTPVPASVVPVKGLARLAIRCPCVRGVCGALFMASSARGGFCSTSNDYARASMPEVPFG